MATVTVLAIATLTLAALQIMGGLNRPVGKQAAQCPSTQPASAQPLSTPVATASCSATPTTAASPSESGVIDPTGILIIAIGEQVQAGPAGELLAQAFDQALRLAMDHPDDFGYPWLDRGTNEIVFSVATPEGRSLAVEAAAALAVPSRLREVKHSYAELQQIQDDVTYLRSEGVVDAELIYKVLPDERDNRAMIVMGDLSRPLLEALATRFPPDALAVQVDPNQPPAGY